MSAINQVFLSATPLDHTQLCHVLHMLLRPVHNTTLNNTLHCIVFVLTLVEMQHDAGIESDSILVFPCVAFLHLVIEKRLTF